MKRSTNILISGAGINGMCMALSLSKLGIPSTIIDAGPKRAKKLPPFNGRAFALSQATQQMLQVLDIWPTIEKNATAIQDIKVSAGEFGAGASPFVVHFNNPEEFGQNLGHMLEERHLLAAFQSAVDQDKNIEIHNKQTIQSATEGVQNILVECSEGDQYQTELLIAADGRRSVIPSQIGIQKLSWDYPQSAIVCAVEHQAPHNGTAHQFFAPGGPLAILPLETHKSSLVWTVETEMADRLVALSDAEFLSELKPAFGDFLGDLKLIGSRFCFPLSLSMSYAPVANRVALIGDAAHGIHPLAGQGLNLGFGDVAALAEVLAMAKRRGEDFTKQSVLNRYADWRKRDTTLMGVATDGLNRFFSTEFGAPSFLPKLGLAVAQASAPMRRAMMQKAAGSAENAPKLLKGLLP